MRRIILAGCLGAGALGGTVATAALMATPEAAAVTVTSDCIAPPGGSSTFPVQVSWPYLSTGDGHNVLDPGAAPHGADGVVLQACVWNVSNPSAPLGSVTVGQSGGGYVLVQTAAGYVGYDG